MLECRFRECNRTEGSYKRTHRQLKPDSQGQREENHKKEAANSRTARTSFSESTAYGHSGRASCRKEAPKVDTNGRRDNQASPNGKNLQTRNPIRKTVLNPPLFPRSNPRQRPSLTSSSCPATELLMLHFLRRLRDTAPGSTGRLIGGAGGLEKLRGPGAISMYTWRRYRWE